MNVRGKRVLIIGDSLSHRGGSSAPVVYDVREGTNRTSSVPGDLLGSFLLEAGAAAVRVDAKVSRSAWNFFRVEDGHALLRADQAWKPQIVIVLLGTNDLGLSMTKDAEAMGIIRNAFTAIGAEVWAVGPPSFISAKYTAETPAVMQMLQNVFGKAYVIDARPLTSDLTKAGRAGDGVHFAATGAKTFATRLAQVLLRTQPGQIPSPPAQLPGSGASSQSAQADDAQHFLGWSLGIGMLAIVVAITVRTRRQRANSSTEHAVVTNQQK